MNAEDRIASLEAQLAAVVEEKLAAQELVIEQGARADIAESQRDRLAAALRDGLDQQIIGYDVRDYDDGRAYIERVKSLLTETATPQREGRDG